MAENTAVAEKKTFSLALTEKLDSVSEALPKDFNKARFVQNALALINDNPSLQKYSQSQLTAGLLKGAYLGLDFYSKECYLVPYGNQLNYQTDYRGAKKLAKKYSIRPIKDIYAKLVREGDSFEEKIVSGEQTFDFKPLPFNDGKIIGAFPLLGAYLDEDERIRIEAYFQCHGGITFADGGENSNYPIESDLWWFGFDCGHAGDKADLDYAIMKFPNHREQLIIRKSIEDKYPIDGDIVRTEPYVAEECEKLAEQLKEFEVA